MLLGVAVGAIARAALLRRDLVRWVEVVHSRLLRRTAPSTAKDLCVQCSEILGAHL
jgi:hypothetical protein